MGVDVKGCSLSIHFGPPATLEEYLQQTGRIGRDGAPSYAIMLKFKGCYKGLKVDENMKAFCETALCRQNLVMGIISNEAVPQEIKHTCDNCEKTCSCFCVCDNDKCICASSCQDQDILKNPAEMHISRSNSMYNLHSQGFKRMVYVVTEDEREIFKSKLFEYRDSLLTDTEQQQVVSHPDFTTGFSSHLIALLVENMEYLESVGQLMTDYPLFNIRHAHKILDFLRQISPEIMVQSGDHLESPVCDHFSNVSTSSDDFSDTDSHLEVYVEFSGDSELDDNDFEEVHIS